jgi:hypothetical protein
MSQNEDTSQSVPPKVTQLLDEARRFGGEPKLRQVNDRHWQITFGLTLPGEEEPAGMVTLDVKRTSSNRITKPIAKVVYKGKVAKGRDWRQLYASIVKKEQQPVVDIPDMPEVRSIEEAPARVREQYEVLVRRLDPNVTIRVGFENACWVIGVDQAQQESDESLYAIRLYYRQRGGAWKPDTHRFFAAVCGLTSLTSGGIGKRWWPVCCLERLQR